MSGTETPRPSILVVPWTVVPSGAEDGTLSPAEMQLGVETAGALRDAGVIVVVHDDVERVRLLHPEPAEISGSTLLRCAMRALAKSGSVDDGGAQRSHFALEVAKAIEAGDA